MPQIPPSNDALPTLELTPKAADTKPVKGAHMVSKSYIRAWADERGVLDVLDLEEGRGYPISYKKATIVSYVYEPELLNHDLEGEYSRIESAGIPVIVKLREGFTSSDSEMTELIEFLDMHRYRGRYADRAGVRIPALAVKRDGTAEDTELSLGDMLLLTRNRDPGLRLTTLGLEQRTWTVWEADDIPTGDGAVMLWRPTKDASIFVTFPLSPTQLLVIGEEPPPAVSFRDQLARGSRRWIIGKRGTLRFSQAAVIAAARAAERAPDATE